MAIHKKYVERGLGLRVMGKIKVWKTSANQA